MSYSMEGWEIRIEVARAIRYHLYAGEKRKPCMWCATPLEIDEATIEHIVPASHGGELSLQNAGIACTSCNQKRGTRSVDEFLGSAWLLQKRQQTHAQKKNRRIPRHQDGVEMTDEEVRLAAHFYLGTLTKAELSAIIMGTAKPGHLDHWAGLFQELNS